MNALVRWYFRTPLVARILGGFIIGSVIGVLLWMFGPEVAEGAEPAWKTWIEPFGAVFVNMLKMIVIPVIFFSLVVGAASLPIKRFGRIGLKVIAWYFFCSVLAAVVGVVLALTINPGSGADLAQWEQKVEDVRKQQKTEDVDTAVAEEEEVTFGGAYRELLLSMFENPFSALSNGNFLPIVVFAILFGLAVRTTIESGEEDEEEAGHMKTLVDVFLAARDGMFKLVDWILEYSPIGVLALSIVNLGTFGPDIIGSYVSVTVGVVAGIIAMIFIVYPILLWTVTRKNPLVILGRIKEAMIMAFMTRSSAATLPVSLKVARDELRVRGDLASFSLPLGATINMDGVCIHLPMFAVLAANMFGVDLSATALLTLVLTTVLASVGAGGVPGGSLLLLFLILGMMGLDGGNIALIVGLATGINPILDMFETMNNITGDLVCTYVVADNEGLVEVSEAVYVDGRST